MWTPTCRARCERPCDLSPGTDPDCDSLAMFRSTEVSVLSRRTDHRSVEAVQAKQDAAAVCQLLLSCAAARVEASFLWGVCSGGHRLCKLDAGGLL